MEYRRGRITEQYRRGPETSKVIPLFGPEATQIPRAITSLSTLENRDLDLIKPRRMHPREVEMQVRMRRQKIANHPTLQQRMF